MTKLDDFEKIYHNDKEMVAINHTNKAIWSGVFSPEYHEFIFNGKVQDISGKSIGFEIPSEEIPSGNYKIVVTINPAILYGHSNAVILGVKNLTVTQASTFNTTMNTSTRVDDKIYSPAGFTFPTGTSYQAVVRFTKV